MQLKSKTKSSRRVFMVQVLGTASALAFIKNSVATTKLDTNDAYAKPMGFKLELT